MALKPLSHAQLLQAVRALADAKGNESVAARSLSLKRAALQHRLSVARLKGITPKSSDAPIPTDLELRERLRRILRRDPVSLDVLAERLELTRGKVLDLCDALRNEGANIFIAGDHVSLENTPIPVSHDPELHVFKSDAEGRYRFGVVSDNHLCSRYAREDVLNDLYDIFERDGITRVYNAGNWIDGEASFNKFDIHVYGMTPQLNYFATHYPQRKGITTYFVAGDDHEGWYAKNHGVDIGRMAERVARDMGRTDLRYLGYMESFIKLEHARTGKASQMLVVHPGGGSSYAISYAPQKYVECVPFDTDILTERGWKRHHELVIGERVLGYNSDTGRCEWTTLNGLSEFPQREVVTYENDNFRVRCTRNHRWALELEARGGPNPASLDPKLYSKRVRVMGTIDEYRRDWRRARVIQAAPGPDGEGFAFTDHHSMLDRPNSESAVLRMTSDQRRAFIYGMLLGEGTRSGIGERKSVVFSQNPGPVLEAFSLACFMEGVAVSRVYRTVKVVNGTDRVNGRVTLLRKPMRMLSSMREVVTEIADTWCPTTGLGTWVMRQNGVISITGNSLQGGEKPAIVLFGHWHKMSVFNYRNVWIVSCGTTEDQTPFMRKQKLEAHVGGIVIELFQDEFGAITRCKNEQIRYFDRSYYNNSYSVAGPVTRNHIRRKAR